MRRQIGIVLTTHWDREWYFTQEQSKVLFAFHFKEVINSLSDGTIDHYLLDGQVSILDEYLNLYPNDREVVKKLVASKRLTIGPWWTQSDQMIVKANSLINNLKNGINYSKDLGAEKFIGYVPDSFGQMSDTPKLLNSFGIENYVFWRGNSDSKSKNRNFIWSSNDGSNLKAHNLSEGYWGGGIVYWGDEESINKYIDKITKNTSILPIASLGGDQRSMDFTFKKHLIELNEKYPNFEFMDMTYFRFFDEHFKTESEYKGELLDSRDSKIHRSIYSSRADIKNLNARNETFHINSLVPMSLIASTQFENDFENFILNQEQVIATTQSHDSIGNCNTDNVNLDIKARIEKTFSGSNALFELQQRKIVEAIGLENSITIFNTLSNVVDSVFEISITSMWKDIQLYLDGKPIDMIVTKTEVHNSDLIRKNIADVNHKFDYFVHTVWVANQKLNPLSYITLDIKNEETHKSISFKSTIDISLEKNNGIRITNSKKQVYYINFKSVSDDGDSYDFSGIVNDKKVEFEYGLLTKNENEYFISNEYLATYTRPYSIDSVELVEQKIYFSVTIEKQTSNVYIKTKTINYSIEHRLTLNIDHNINSNVSKSDQGFGFIQRTHFQDEFNTWKKENWHEEPSNIYPTLSTVIVENKNRTLNVFLNGTKEFIPSNNNCEFTLFRSYSYLGKPEIDRRPGKASGLDSKKVPTPDSELLGLEIKNEFMINFEELNDAQLKTVARCFETKITFAQNQSINVFENSMKFFTFTKLLKKLPKHYSLINSLNLDSNLSIDAITFISQNKYILSITNNSLNAILAGSKISLNDEFEISKSNLALTKNEKSIFSKLISIDDMKPNETIHYELKVGEKNYK